MVGTAVAGKDESRIDILNLKRKNSVRSFSALNVNCKLLVML